MYCRSSLEYLSIDIAIMTKMSAEHHNIYTEILPRLDTITPLKCKNEYLVLALGKETAVQVVVGSIFLAIHRLKNRRVGR